MFASRVRINLGPGQYRNAVASGQPVHQNILEYCMLAVDPTLPRYGTDPIQLRF